MIKLLRNEYEKLFKRPIVWLLTVLLIIAALAYALAENAYQDKQSEIDLGWREGLISEIESLQDKLNDMSIAVMERQELEMLIKIDNFRLDHEIIPSDWRYRVVSVYFGLIREKSPEAQEQADKIYEYIITDDWKAYLRMNEYQYYLAIDNYEETTFQYIEAKIYLDENDLRYQYDIKPVYNNWKHNMADELTENRLKVIMSEMFFADENLRLSDAQVDNLKNRNLMILYRIQHDYPETGRKTLPFSMNATVALTVLVTLFAIVLTSLCITSEYSYQTVLQLFSYPYNRYKVILAKMVALGSIVFGFIVIQYSFSILFGGLFFGFEVLSPHLLVANGSIVEINYFVYILIKYGLATLETIIYVSIAAAISVATKNAPVTICLVSLPALLAKPVLKTLTIDYKLNHLNWIPFSSYDFNQFLDNDLIVSGLSLELAMLITLLTLLTANAATLIKVGSQDF